MTENISSSLQQDLTTRLMNIVYTWPRRNFEPEELQGCIDKTVSDYDYVIEQDVEQVVTRRNALRSLVLFPIEFCGLAALSSRKRPTQKQSTEDILAYCAAGITACWHLRSVASRKGKELPTAFDAVSMYIPVLQSIASSSMLDQQRTTAYTLLAQSYILKATQASHLENNDQVALYDQEALRYSQASGSPASQALAWRHMVVTQIYANRWEQALHHAMQAKQFVDGTSPNIQSFVYSALAMCQSHNNQKSEAMASLKKAHETYDYNTPPPIWMHYAPSILASCDGITHHNLGIYNKAVASFKQVGALGASMLTKLEATFDLLETEITRDDQPRDMELCINLWQQGLYGAQELRSEQRFSEARNAYTMLNAAWPGEPRIKGLRDLLVHW